MLLLANPEAEGALHAGETNPVIERVTQPLYETALLAPIPLLVLRRRRGKGMATIHDVALDANVSPTTVSRYINNRIELPAATAARIDAAIAKLDYRPNLLARRLSTGRTEAIGLVTPEIREPFFAELASAVEDEADRHGYTIFMSSTRSDRQREIASLNRLHDRHVDGLIMMTNTPDDGTLAALIGKRRNVVLIDEDIPGVQVPRVFVENEIGAYKATRYLIDAGHEKIGYISGPRGLYTVEQRRAGYLRAMNEAGLKVRPEHLAGGSFAPDFSRKATLEPGALHQAVGCLQGRNLRPGQGPRRGRSRARHELEQLHRRQGPLRRHARVWCQRPGGSPLRVLRHYAQGDC